MKPALLAAAVLLAALTALPVATAEAEGSGALAPPCGPFVGVRCADGGQFCWVYVHVVVHECLP